MRNSVNLLIFFCFYSTFVQAQQLEYGFQFGLSNYRGELARNFELLNSRPAIGGLLRYNLSNSFALKTSLNFLQLQASDNWDSDPFPTGRDKSFSGFAFEYYAAAEYNFLDYRDKTTRRNWTPYFTGGIGVAYITSIAEASKFQPVIPLGVGMRWYLSKRLNLGVEFTVRKTFTDQIDRTSDNPIVVNSLPKLDGFRDDNDKYYFTAFHLTYSLYKIPCPFFYN